MSGFFRLPLFTVVIMPSQVFERVLRTLGRVPGVLHRHTAQIHIDQDPNRDRYPLANTYTTQDYRAEYGAWALRNSLQDAIV